MIISIGYRVRSVIATRFRQWATKRLTMPCPHNDIGGSNGKVVCPRNTAGTGHKTEYSRRQDTKQNTAGDRTQNRIQQETGHKTEYRADRTQKRNTAGDRTQNRIQQETGQRNGGNTRLSRTALKHNDKQRAK